MRVIDKIWFLKDKKESKLRRLKFDEDICLVYRGTVPVVTKVNLDPKIHGPGVTYKIAEYDEANTEITFYLKNGAFIPF